MVCLNSISKRVEKYLLEPVEFEQEFRKNVSQDTFVFNYHLCHPCTSNAELIANYVNKNWKL